MYADLPWCGMFQFRSEAVGFTSDEHGEPVVVNLGQPDGLLFVKKFELEHHTGEMPLDSYQAMSVMMTRLARELQEAEPQGRA
jgi:hypothetical protein